VGIFYFFVIINKNYKAKDK